MLTYKFYAFTDFEAVDLYLSFFMEFLQLFMWQILVFYHLWPYKCGKSKVEPQINIIETLNTETQENEDSASKISNSNSNTNLLSPGFSPGTNRKVL